MYYYSKVNSFSLMGVSNCESMLLSEKDLFTAVEFNFLVKPIDLECQANNVQDQQQQQQEDHRYDMSSVELKPNHENYSNGFKTPMSLDHKIPAALKCPPAPRKPRPVPAAAMKRRPATTARRRVFLDLSAEIECLFPPAILADLIGGKIKKLRQGKNNDGVL